MSQIILVTVVVIPGTAQSAVYGVIDLFQAANRILSEMQQAPEVLFETVRWQVGPEQAVPFDDEGVSPTLVIVPPILEGQAYLEPQPEVCAQLADWHKRGAVVSSACAGSFLLAQAGMLTGRKVTTHWQLEGAFKRAYPEVDGGVG
jgi:transcriptional regulator GlxA family with amidase domain